MLKKGFRRSNSADNLSHQDYDLLRRIENARTNDFGIGDFLINQNKSKPRGRPTPMNTGRLPTPLPVPSSSKIVKEYTGDKLPPPPLYKENVEEEYIPPTIDVRDLPPAFPSAVNTFVSLNPQSKSKRMTTKPKSKGGKNKTKKRKAKKTKKNKKTRK